MKYGVQAERSSMRQGIRVVVRKFRFGKAPWSMEFVLDGVYYLLNEVNEFCLYDSFEI